MSIIHARAWVFGDDVDTDLIYHNKYLAETDPKNMPQYAFEYYPGKENFAKEVKPGDIVVAGKNFGCGSSREHAVYCLQYAGVPCVFTTVTLSIMAILCCLSRESLIPSKTAISGTAICWMLIWTLVRSSTQRTERLFTETP